MRVIYLLLGALMLAACGSDSEDAPTFEPPTFEATLTFSVELTGSQQVPTNNSDQVATAEVQIDENLMLMRATLNAESVSGFEAAHVHSGSVGMNGEVLFAFGESGSSGYGADADYTIEETAITQEVIDQILNHNAYINLHTEAFPDGEIRGQVVSDSATVLTFALSGRQEVPAVATDASGFAYAVYDSTDGALQLTARTNGVDDATAAHIHTGRVGVNGDVLVALESAADETGVWVTASELTIDADTFAALASGGHYVNVHTPAHPSGELRGQILTANHALAAFALSGQQEVPAVTSSATGSGYALVDTTDFSVELTLVTEGVDDATAAHIHTGRVGNNGDVLVALEQSAEMPGVWTAPANFEIDADTFAVLASGGHYVNVHTPANPSGELRGQILTDNYALAAFALSGQQEVPAVATAGSGSGYALIDLTDYAIELTLVTEGVDDATAAHIHTGRVGANGDVLVALEQSMDSDGVWMTPDDLTLDAETFAVLASGGHYVNVHTPANPSGELRGQIITDNYVLAAFALSGQQEVPAVATTASGSGYALIDTITLGVELTVVTDGVDNATAAHIHTGRVGSNGDVLVALEASTDRLGVWHTPADLTIDAETFAALASGGHYVNVHTPANPSGELRGQILTSNYVLAAFTLSGQQEVPAVTTTASGSGYALVNVFDFAVEMTVITEGVDNATAAHIHTGRVGSNGDVLVALETSTDAPGVWTTPEDLTLDAETFAVLASGGHYVNVHTPANPSGELRGQIVTDNYVLVAFALSGAQEVPAVVTAAFGSGYALIDSIGLNLELTVVTTGVADATAAHIHTGDFGVNGEVLVALEASTSIPGVWLTPAELTINADTFAVLAAGGHYVNVHTPANPSGELRGQIE